MGIQLPFSAALDNSLSWKERLLPKLVICSGKGGVGKTTITAALACARAREGKHVLVVSVDPAHSLGDSLGMDLSDAMMHVVPGYSTLQAQEIKIEMGMKPKPPKHVGHASPDDAITDPEFMQKAFDELYIPISEEFNVLSSLIVAWRSAFQQSILFDEIYVDGAPSGHMLRTLSYPFRMKAYLGKVGAAFQGIKRAITLDPSKRAMLQAKDNAMKSYATLMDLLGNPALSTMILVTIPETMALAETERTFTELQSLGIQVSNIVINKVHDGNTNLGMVCKYCAERSRNEGHIITAIEQRFKDMKVTRIPLLCNEVEGIPALKLIEPFLLF
jgi:arsenite-transporting ATPase